MNGTHIKRALLIILALTAVACSESDATATVTDGDASDLEVSEREARAAERALESQPVAPANGLNGVVLAENADGYGSDWSVLTDDGVTIISLATNCDDDWDDIREPDLVLILDPGDLISWVVEGKDNLVCSGEVHVLEKRAT